MNVYLFIYFMAYVRKCALCEDDNGANLPRYIRQIQHKQILCLSKRQSPSARHESILEERRYDSTYS